MEGNKSSTIEYYNEKIKTMEKIIKKSQKMNLNQDYSNQIEGGGQYFNWRNAHADCKSRYSRAKFTMPSE